MRSWTKRSRRRLATGVIASLTVLGAAACGGPGAYNDAIGRAAPPGTELPAAAAVAVPGAVPAETAPSAPRQADSRTFCLEVQQLQSLVPILFQPNGAPTVMTQAKALSGRIIKDAPAEIRPAVTEMAQTTSRLVADLSAHPPNLADVAQVFTDPAYQQSLQQVITYTATHC